MSETKQISPLLDGFTMGNPMSEHDGIRCCPAIKEDSENKYIVKIIAIPSSQVQMDALLLAGAYKDASEAMDYFKTVVDDVFKEAELLRKLSKLEGFLSYEGWQMEPITRRRLGYEVYLLGSYRRSLDKFVKKNPITHLEAINLGLDMCSALSVCRQAGALYVDLKPTNIFVSDKKEYSIGDLGFVSLDALSYTALPDKYRSAYTPPELCDPMESVNMTTDTYALGMILYQIYNDGQLPVRDGEEPLAAPVHADYELAEIILKAISQDPKDRWQDPKDMGHALVAYMQRNAVNDVPITPYVPLEESPEEKPEPVETPAEEAPEDTPQSEPVDETVPGDDDAMMPHEMSDELSRIMAKADDLIAHETPEGVSVPEEPEAPDPFAFAKEDEVDDGDVPLEPVMEDEPESEEKKKKAGSFASQAGKQKRQKLMSNLLSLLLVAGILFGFVWTYQNLYIQTIDKLSITGSRNQLTVRIDSKANEALLTVNCTDQYGNVLTQGVRNGQASFTGLQPNTMYQIALEVDGFHKLAGQTSEMFTTDTTTRIVSFTSVAGSEDGSLILNFTVDGEEPEEWTLFYSAPGEEARKETFSGHSITVERLKVGKVYTFTLEAGSNLSLGGTTTLEVMPARLILAQDITIDSDGSGDASIRWRAPGDIVVDSWTIRCYSDNGYDEELTVKSTEAYFTGLDPNYTYTIEITAEGMTQSARTGITANPITVTGLSVDESDPQALSIDWEYEGDSPAGGWLLMYTIDGNGTQSVIRTESSQAVLTPRIPDATYRFTVRAADGTTVFSGVHDYESGSAEPYDGNGLKASDLTTHLLKTPSQKNWLFEQVGEESFTNEFVHGEQISMVLKTDVLFYHPGQEIQLTYVIRDAHGTVLTDWIAQEKDNWKTFWEGGDTRIAELDLPKIPGYVGDFSVEVLVDGMLLGKADFSISK